jgi:hypothetical protein
MYREGSDEPWMGRVSTAMNDARPLLLLLAVVLNACSGPPAASARDVADANDTGRTLSPQTANERQLLQQLSQLPNGKAQRIGDTNVIADAPYSAASGHTCRAVQLTGGPKRTADHRLACTDGHAWFFVPDVFVGAKEE